MNSPARMKAPALAYLDGGTASIILQFLAAGILGSLFFMKGLWLRVRDWAASLFRRNSKTDE